MSERVREGGKGGEGGEGGEGGREGGREVGMANWLKQCMLSQNTSPMHIRTIENLTIDTNITKIGQQVPEI